MRNWAIAEQRPMDVQIGVHQSNPAITPLEQCRYVVCIGLDRPITRRGKVGSAEIPGGLHAVFDFQGRYGELLPYITKIHEDWLPNSEFLAETTPAFAEYRKNQYLSEDDQFDLQFYLPIRPGWLV